jgi:hypothetical protein
MYEWLGSGRGFYGVLPGPFLCFLKTFISWFVFLQRSVQLVITQEFLPPPPPVADDAVEQKQSADEFSVALKFKGEAHTIATVTVGKVFLCVCVCVCVSMYVFMFVMEHLGPSMIASFPPTFPSHVLMCSCAHVLICSSAHLIEE